MTEQAREDQARLFPVLEKKMPTATSSAYALHASHRSRAPYEGRHASMPPHLAQ
ncbi:hypothetical protein M0D69_03835 [Caballeronia sp. SEWSISQ10-4 2]|uniref:hypothetical protein n=1 Tax=Caballeronia sp. SEWSISQ10-4 2 TaxID=2937438 RepID=UPI00264D4545|nr:hypothetical protein [Caballeronia sp. SEWSISQ10-4 2]MDN7177154.1 hypothetical protein [Caballeronia sp. SEWSISQ10-4 2]